MDARLIDAHDEDDDGNLEFEELLNWAQEGLSMTEGERVAQRERGGHYIASTDFLEDIAHAFHADLVADDGKE